MLFRLRKQNLLGSLQLKSGYHWLRPESLILQRYHLPDWLFYLPLGLGGVGHWIEAPAVGAHHVLLLYRSDISPEMLVELGLLIGLKKYV